MPERKQRKDLADPRKPRQSALEQRRRRGGQQHAGRQQAGRRSRTPTVLSPFEDELAVVSEMGPPA